MDKKQCNKCGENKLLTEYHKATRNSDGYCHTCKTCRKQIDATYYHTSNKKFVIIKRRKEMSKWITEYKRQKGCKYCWEKEPVALDFHHRNNKEFSIGNSFRRFSVDRVKIEITKCDVVCSNCHRKIHGGVNGPWV